MQLKNYAADKRLAGSGKQADLIDAITGELFRTRQRRLLHGMIRAGAWLFAWSIAPVLSAQPGTLDGAFGTNGVLVMPHPDDWLVQGRSLTIDAEGRCLVVGGHGTFSDHYLARVMGDGAADAAFGTSGYASHVFSVASDWAADVIVLPDGRFITAGSAGDSLCVARFLSSGELDASFGTGGSIRVGSASGLSWGTAIVRRPDGRLVVAGRVADDFGVVQLTADGDLDAAFGNAGIVTIQESSAIDMAYALALRPDGSLIAVGRIGDLSFSEVVVAQFLPNGDPDAAFGSNGQLRLNPTPFADMANDVVLAPNGDAIMCMDLAGMGVFARISPEGALDAGFGDMGMAPISFLGDSAMWLSSLLLQPDGRIVGAGSVRVDELGQLAVVRLLADGSRDTGFGLNGLAVHDIVQSDGEGFYDLALAPDGHLVACGTAQYSGEDRAVIARFRSGMEVGLDELEVRMPQLRVWPVPVDDRAILTFGSDLLEPIRIEVVDGLGRLVQRLAAVPASGRVELVAHGLENGPYSIRCCAGMDCRVARVVVYHSE